ncbi:hypothetical protein [Nocardia tengchongensis]|uniref:hypothetical protein n=1 Tax=Nocardia tengchongensis TaxID=2055889 RepID=UPI0036A62070
MTVTEVSVREFLKQWVVGELAWANTDHTKAGWATVTDWKPYTAEQAETINELRGHLEATRKSRDSFRDTIKEQAAQLQTKQNQIDNQARFIVSETTRADTAEAESSRLAVELEPTRGQRDHHGEQRGAAEQRVKTLTAKAEQQATKIGTANGKLKWRTRMIWLLVIVCAILLIVVTA